jgi:hypothetical protein
MSDSLEELLRASLTATTDAERVELGAEIARVPDVIAKISERLRSQDWDTRRLAMHFVTRLAPPPEELTPAIVTALVQPIACDAFGEETVLGLVIAGAIAPRVTAQRSAIEQRLGWIEREISIGSNEVADHPGEPTQFDARAAIVKKLALDTLKKIDAAIALEREKHDALIAKLAERFATDPGQAIAMVELQAATMPERDSSCAGIWESIANHFARSSPKHREALEHAVAALRRYASYSTSGGEGMARMADVHALERQLAALPSRA